MASSKLRSYTFCPTLLLLWLNFSVLLSSSASIAVVFLLRHTPTHFGWALFTASSFSFISSLTGLCSQFNKLCFVTTVCMLTVSLIGEGLGFLMLFFREGASIKFLHSTRDPREAKALIRVNTVLLLAMFLMQMMVLVTVCILQSCLVAKYRGLESQREETAKRRSKRMAQVQEESLANVAKMEETKSNDLDERMKAKYGQWTRPADFEV
ncbi:hypothetical protein EJ110_NYTH49631 [Nymphaea thermarum]|nr:hypothetical protein EJ110_NYTH49631 [Nymphaea thermarum]